MKSDITGAFGDIGVLLPLAFGIVVFNGLNPTLVFSLVAVVYIISGLYFKVPVPVQPLKAMAAIAIAKECSPSLIFAGAITVGTLLLFFQIKKVRVWLSYLFSVPIVKGIQLAVGLVLIKSGINFLTGCKTLNIISSENITMFLNIPSLKDFTTAFFVLVLPQIPLTLGNAVFACYDAEKHYFKEKAKRVTPRALALSIALSNIIIGFLGGMPVCHGSGGVTAHYKFGAKTYKSNLIIGFTILIVFLLFHSSAVYLIGKIPVFVLGIMLIYVGMFHCLLIRPLLKHYKQLFICCFVGVFSLIMESIAIGFVSGMIVEYGVKKINVKIQ